MLIQFFARESGYLDGECPFEHNETKKRADRDKALNIRHQYMMQGTPEKVSQHPWRLTNQYRQSHEFDPEDELPDEAYEEPPEKSILL